MQFSAATLVRQTMPLCLACAISCFAAPSQTHAEEVSRESEFPQSSALRPVSPMPQPRGETTVNDLLMYALSLSGVRYRFGGRNPEMGFDCSGFVRHVFDAAASLSLPHSSFAMSKVGQNISKEDLKPGDLVFYNTLQRSFSHVGIYLGEGRFVHAPSRGKQVEIVDMSDSFWRRRFDGARRVLNAEIGSDEVGERVKNGD